MKHAEKIERSTKDQQEQFIIHLQPFEDEIHGIRLKDVEAGIMEIWTKKQSFEVEKMELEIHYKPNIIRGYNQITYLLLFTDQDKKVNILLPKEAETAEKMH